jgi:hypothetical protein
MFCQTLKMPQWLLRPVDAIWLPLSTKIRLVSAASAIRGSMSFTYKPLLATHSATLRWQTALAMMTKTVIASSTELTHSRTPRSPNATASTTLTQPEKIAPAALTRMTLTQWPSLHLSAATARTESSASATPISDAPASTALSSSPITLPSMRQSLRMLLFQS